MCQAASIAEGTSATVARNSDPGSVMRFKIRER